MKKVLGIVLLVLAISLVSAPAFAQQAELDLKFWYAGVAGADEWVADYGEYEYPNGEFMSYEVHPLNGYYYGEHAYTKTLTLQPGIGASFILSGKYSIYPSISVGMSYWGLSRADEVGVELAKSSVGVSGLSTDMVRTMNGVPESYWIQVPWWENEYPLWWCNAVLFGEETLSISALDICATKTLSGPGWEAGLSGGVRRAIFNEHLSTELELVNEADDGSRVIMGLDSKLNVSAIGPQVDIEGSYALTDKLALKAGAKAGLLFAIAQTDATWEANWWDYDSEASEWILNEDYVGDSRHEATDATRITTYDLSAALAYQITEQWSVEAGYYASIWKGVPAPYFFDYNAPSAEAAEPVSAIENERSAWEQPEPRDIIVRGLTLGVNFKF